MTYEPLHHKYRPQTFADLVGQSAITTTLSNALKSSRIAPAYLFTGPRGTGKTSSARILAKSLNCLASSGPTPTPCGQCEVCKAIASGSALDIIEIDAASNTGVDNIREIIDRAQFAPVQCRYKVYIIDEVHMLSTAAFNALLKTLEEPPDRVTFILATTDPQRVLPTIISRCQRFDYRRIPLDEMVAHLSKIAELENIDIEPAAVSLVAQIANGGLRDAESLLDQLSLLQGTITVDRIWDLVGAVPEKDLFNLLVAIRESNPEAIIEQCRHLMNRGKEPLTVLQNLAGFYLNLLLARTSPNRPDLVAVTAPTWEALCREAAYNWSIDDILQGQKRLKDSEVQIKNTTQPRLWLEITLMGLLETHHSQPQQGHSITPPAVKPLPIPEVKPSPVNHALETQEKKPPAINPAAPQPEIETSPITNPVKDNISTEEIWPRVISAIGLATTRTLLQQKGKLLSFSDSVARIGLSSEALLNIVRKKIDLVETAFESVCGQKVKVHFQVINDDKPAPEEVRDEKAEYIKDNLSRSTPDQQPIEKPQHQPSIQSSQKVEPVNSREKPQLQPLNQDAQKSNNVNIEEAIVSFTKAFGGELVHTESLEVTPSANIIIKNRPEIDGIPEDELPF